MSKKFKAKFHLPEDIRTCYASSVWGGFSQKGMFEINFIHDRPSLPKSVVDEVDDHGIIVDSKPEKGDYNIVRTVQSIVIMDYDSAKQFSEWLNRKIEEFESHTTIKSH